MKISFLKYFPIKMFPLPFPASLNCIVDDARRYETSGKLYPIRSNEINFSERQYPLRVGQIEYHGYS